MDFQKFLEIAAITVPVFGAAAIGKILAHYNILNSSNRQPISWITYYLALPALIFNSFITKEPFDISISALLTLSLLAIALSSLFVYTCLFFSKKPCDKEKKTAAVYLSYWGNNGYVGIPLAVSAVGAAYGLPLAAVINGLSVPFYITISMILMYKSKAHSEHKQQMKDEFLHHTLLNPVIIAMIAGAALASLRPYLPESFTSNSVTTTVFKITTELLGQIGDMGLPLALLLVGSNLSLKEIKGDKFLLTVSVAGKLIIAPASVFFTAYLLFPSLSKESFQVLVLLNAVPGAVASYIISEKFKCAEEFVSSSLVLSTLFSIVTIPLWLHFLL